MRLKQGEVWWADMEPPMGYRPVLLLTRDSVINGLGSVTTAPLTRTRRYLPSEVELSPAADGVITDCVASLDNVTTIPKELLVNKLTVLSVERMNEIWEALHFAFELPY